MFCCVGRRCSRSLVRMLPRFGRQIGNLGIYGDAPPSERLRSNAEAASMYAERSSKRDASRFFSWQQRVCCLPNRNPKQSCTLGSDPPRFNCLFQTLMEPRSDHYSIPTAWTTTLFGLRMDSKLSPHPSVTARPTCIASRRTEPDSSGSPPTLPMMTKRSSRLLDRNWFL